MLSLAASLICCVQDAHQRAGALAVTSIAALLPPLLLVLGPRWAASMALGVGLGAALLSLLQLRCVHGSDQTSCLSQPAHPQQGIYSLSLR